MERVGRVNLDTDLTVLRVRPPDGGFERRVEKRPSGRRRRRGVHARACAASRGGGRRPTEWNGGGGGVRACVRARVPNERTTDRPNERTLCACRARCARSAGTRTNSYLVDPASSYMLVSKIKPCMSKYIPRHGETANGSLNRSLFIGSFILLG